MAAIPSSLGARVKRVPWKVLALLGAGAWLLFGGNRGLVEWMELSFEKRALTEDIRRLEGEIARLTREYEAYGKDRTLIERRAREELHLVRPGERLYKFRSQGRRKTPFFSSP